MTMLPAAVAGAGGHAKKSPPKKVPKTETLFLWFTASGDYKAEATGNIGPGCQSHDTETDHIEWDSQYEGVKVNVNGQNSQVTVPADAAATTLSSWKMDQDGNGDDCGADVDCTSEHIAIGDPSDPQPQAFAVGEGKTVLELKVEVTGSDFIANDTQGNQACPTQVTGQGSLLFLALLNDHLGSIIPLYFTADLKIPISSLQGLAVGGELPQKVKITHIPPTDCETSLWTFCQDKLSWQGTVYIKRTA
jgi:hypothetical protein